MNAENTANCPPPHGAPHDGMEEHLGHSLLQLRGLPPGSCLAPPTVHRRHYSDWRIIYLDYVFSDGYGVKIIIPYLSIQTMGLFYAFFFFWSQSHHMLKFFILT